MLKRTSHAVYELSYHFVWIPKRRRKVLEGRVRTRMKELLREICEGYGWELIEQEVMIDHVHVFVSAPPRYSAGEMVQAMKSITARRIFQEFPSLREVMVNDELWSDGYLVRAVGEKVTAAIIQRYIQHQERQDKGQQLRLF